MFATLRQAHEALSSAAYMGTQLAEFDLDNYRETYEGTRDSYLEAAAALKLATGPYEAARDAYVAAVAAYTKTLYE